jgi:hypothetical protein
LLATTFFYPFSSAEAFENGGDQACTHSIHRFCIPKSLCGEPPPVSTQNELTSCCVRGHGAVRFLFWWLFLHRRLRLRQRGSASFDASGLALLRLIISEERYSFLSEQLEASFDSPQQAFRLRLWTIMVRGFRSLSLPSNASPRQLALPRSGQKARKQFRL